MVQLWLPIEKGLSWQSLGREGNWNGVTALVVRTLDLVFLSPGF